MDKGELPTYTYLVPRIHWDTEEIPEGANKNEYREFAPNT